MSLTSPGKGYFITFEGPEGSGKSLQSRLLTDRLRSEGRAVMQLREPGGTPVGDQLRELLLMRGDLTIGARSQTLILCAARAQIVDDCIQPALDEGNVVVCDRYADSTLAYQGYGHGLSLDELRSVLAFTTRGLKPDLTLLLDVPVREGLARKQRQHAESPEAWNRFEAEEEAFHERVRSGYHALALAEPDRWHLLDATEPPERLAEQVWDLVRRRLT